jgi:acyl-[acyl-carrier-protein]-phospholipid O-acyltransferase / long-chain-fatty-acid--[acyl-carrier-protein] ligase
MGKNFIFLNTVQFLDALNENLFKYIVVYFLIYYQGHESTSLVMSITGAVFILPFILFSSLGGVFADRWSKTKIIQITRLLQVLFMIGAFFFILFQEGNLIYLLLFIITSLSAIFGPSKYGIISELASKDHLLKANGYIAAFTYFGIILGTALASLLDTLTHETFSLMMIACILFSIIGAILSYLIPKTEPADPDKRWPLFVYKEIGQSLKEMYKTPSMLTAAFCYGYVVFIGAFVQMNIIPYSVTTLGMPPVVGGYLFLFSSIGVGIGALIATKASGKLTSLPLWTVGMSVGCFLFTLFPFPFWVNAVWLIGLGIVAGLFLVPPQAFILSHSLPEDKGMNFGTANFFSFIFALLAAGVLYLFNSILEISPSMSFSWIGMINLAVAGFLYFLTRQKKTYS